MFHTNINMDKILVNGVRVFTPDEFKALRKAMDNTHRVLFSGLVFTGMRIVEFEQLLQHPEWVSSERSLITLPPGTTLKVKVKMKSRTVLLSSWGLHTVEELFEKPREMPSNEAWRTYLSRKAKIAGIGDEGVKLKSARKTWESWLVACFPESSIQIMLSQGHTTAVALNHYLTLGFSGDEVGAMMPYTMGWKR